MTIDKAYWTLCIERSYNFNVMLSFIYGIIVVAIDVSAVKLRVTLVCVCVVVSSKHIRILCGNEMYVNVVDMRVYSDGFYIV